MSRNVELLSVYPLIINVLLSEFFAKLSVCPLYLVDVGFDCGDFSKVFSYLIKDTLFVGT